MELDRRIAAALPPVPERWPDTDLRTAAVLLPLLQHDGEDHVLFTQRPDDLPAHGGQIITVQIISGEIIRGGHRGDSPRSGRPRAGRATRRPRRP